MGLFSKKEKYKEEVRVVFYEGELKGFTYDTPCRLLLQKDELQITKINPNIVVHLDRRSVLGLTWLPEIEYMKKYKGTDITQKKDNIPRSFYILDYLDKERIKKQLVFWGTSKETLKVMKMQKELLKDIQSNSYEI